ncbi:MAG TPA: SDR family oxidoreductase [Candidatus Acidoferrales bacterium]|jgi:citronellol/citronellal dehydrogenase|nr:SDR family oxidoreductase [Candidatus Acidoferrales bacterium]
MPDPNPALHPDLRGRVALVTGASRGIGKALALRLAAEGADVVVAAKSEQSSERLPGSIHETAEAIRSSGRRALAVATDVRDEDAIRNMIERAAAEFGRLDMLVNNAGAIWTQPILETPPKRFDLMMGVNVRAAYIACYYALPYMVKQQWGHVLNMCPRLSTEPSPGKVAYMISKLGMARVAIGLAAEHQKDNIAGNALWPRTIIESQASINWKMAGRSQWRTPEILCDASMAIFAQEPRTSTGRQWIDEEVLTELAGVTNFDRYWCEGKPPERPIYIDKW